MSPTRKEERKARTAAFAKDQPVAYAITVLVVIGVVIWVVVAVATGHHSSTPSVPATPAAAPIITYAVTADRPGETVDVTYNNADGSIAQANGVPVPWTLSIPMTKGAIAYVSAQNQGDSGDTTAAILLNGAVAVTHTSTGGYSIATADGKV